MTTRDKFFVGMGFAGLLAVIVAANALFSLDDGDSPEEQERKTVIEFTETFFGELRGKRYDAAWEMVDPLLRDAEGWSKVAGALAENQPIRRSRSFAVDSYLKLDDSPRVNGSLFSDAGTIDCSVGLVVRDERMFVSALLCGEDDLLGSPD